MPNMRDVANMANVSVSTVSVVLSGKKYVSSKLAMRVRSAARELGYGCDQEADSMEENAEAIKDVGLILPGIYSSYFQPLLLSLIHI